MLKTTRANIRITAIFVYKLLFFSVFRKHFLKTLKTFFSINKHKFKSFSEELDWESLTYRYTHYGVTIASFKENTKAINFVFLDLDPKKIFGGIATALQISNAFYRNGFTIRLISLQETVDAPDIKNTLITKFNFESEFVGKIEIYSKNDSFEDIISTTDLFVATFWPTAYFIENTIERNNILHKDFIYLIQDFEPGFYSWSSQYQLAYNTYKMAVLPVYNSLFLADFFQKNKIVARTNNIVLRPEINFQLFSPPSLESMKAKSKTRIVVYGRENIERNLFEFLITSLKIWLDKYKPDQNTIELLSIGTEHETYNLGDGFKLRSIGKMSLNEYADFLKTCDIGVSLMLSPHPSYPPFEMAASGMLVVTNNYANKNLSIISRNIHSVDCVPSLIAETIQLCFDKVGNYETRIANSFFNEKLEGDDIETACQKMIAAIS